MKRKIISTPIREDEFKYPNIKQKQARTVNEKGKLCTQGNNNMPKMVPELDGLGYHEQYSSPPSSGTKWPNFLFFIFLIKLSTSSGHVGLKNMVLELTKLEYHKKW